MERERKGIGGERKGEEYGDFFFFSFSFNYSGYL